MFVPFEELNENSKLWIYQANREFNDAEVDQIKNKIELFLQSWKRHGEDLKASYLIKYNHFIVIAVDENFNEVSGCSIDASVNFIKQLENEFNLDLTNKLNISFKDGDNINVVKLSDFKRFAELKKITPATIVFNNLVNTKADFEHNWEITASESWHKRFLV